MRHPRRRVLIRAFPKASRILLTVLLASLGCDFPEETQSAIYSTREAAQDSVERGWLPPWLPSDARDIQELHNLDSNRVCAVFDLKQQSQTLLRTHLETSGFSQASQQPPVPRKLSGHPCPGSLPERPADSVLSLRLEKSPPSFQNLAFFASENLVFFWTN
jgi:hypothetical protein